MRSRILFVVVCWMLSASTWCSVADALTQTPLRPDASTPAASSPAVTPGSQDSPLRPASQTETASPTTEAPKTSPESKKSPQAAQQPPSVAPQSADKESVAPATPAATDEKPKAASKEPTAKEAPAKKAASTRLGSAQLLPGHTKAWVSIPDVQKLKDSFNKTQFGLLSKDEAIEPFIESVKSQFNDWANEKNVRFGVKIENLDQIYSGEICLAGVVPSIAGQEIERGSHGLVLLVDVSGREEKAKEVLAEVNRRLLKRGATQTKIEINGAAVTRSQVAKDKRLRANQTTLQTIYDGWLLASDNEKIFRDVIFRLATTKPDALKPDALASQPAFKSVMDRSDVGSDDSHVKWFVDPFGYVRLAQALSDDTKDTREHRDDWAKILQGQGFDAIKGAGGQVAFMASGHDLLHRTFVYAPQKNLSKKEQKRVFGLFDFTNDSGKPVAPPKWVPNNVSAFLVGKWNFSNALENVGFLYDAFLDDPGAFERVLRDFKDDPDMQLNIRKLVAQIDNEWMVLSATAKPIKGNSERVAMAFKLKSGADGTFVLDSVRRAIGNGRATKINLGGKTVIEVDSEKSLADDESLDDIDIFDDPSGDDDFDDDEADEEEVFTLFDKKYFAIEHGHLIVANNKDYMKRILANKQKKTLLETSDYQRIDGALKKLVDNENFSWRQFGRLDLALEANYELLRQGKMEKSQTVLAKILNQIFKEQEQKPSEERKVELKRLDGKELPADFKQAIAPYLGVMGWASEVEENGWRVSGCVLKRDK